MTGFSDHFAFAARSYASHRPRYPDALFDWLASVSSRRERAWDCGTGNGQAAVALAGHFEQVVASDPSSAQLASADRVAGVHYVAMTAEQCALRAHSVDLVTVAQALHWFDPQRFFAQVHHVLRPGGSLAVWSYGLLSMDPAVDALLRRFYFDVLGPFWPVERLLVDSGYAGIELPYAETSVPHFTMEATWSLARLIGYVSTWSAVGRYRTATGEDPIPAFAHDLRAAWGMDDTRRARWPLVVRLGRKAV